MRIRFLIFTVLSLFFGATPLFALSVTISDAPANITTEPFTLNVSVSGASPATNYLRVNFFPTGTTHYFGYTYNGTSYVSGSDYSQYLPITIDSGGNWSGTISGKIDTDSSYYSGPGSYGLKVRRYTQSGSSYTWSNEIAIDVTAPTPSPISTTTPTPNPTVTPTPTVKPTSTATPKKTSTPASTPVSTSISIPSGTPTEIPRKKVFLTSKPDYKIASVAAASASATPASSPSPSAIAKNQKQANPLIWLGLSSLLMGGAGIGYIYLKNNGKLHF